MKKLIKLSIFLLVVAVGFAYIDERDTNDAEEDEVRQTEQLRLEREKRLGPKPYFLQVGSRVDTREKKDSLFRYLSNFSRGELLEVKYGVEGNFELREFIDKVMSYQDSLEMVKEKNITSDN